jgi:hypothetical protein
VGDGGTLLLRTEGVWREIPLATREDLRACAVGPDGLVIVGGSGGTLWRSADRGATWATVGAAPRAVLSLALDIRLGGEGPPPAGKRMGVLTHEGRRAMREDEVRLASREGLVHPGARGSSGTARAGRSEGSP